MKSKIKTTLIVSSVILFYVVVIYMIRLVPYYDREHWTHCIFSLYIFVFSFALGLGSYLYPDSNHSPSNKKEKIGYYLCEFACDSRIIFVALIPFFFAGIIT